MNYVALLHECGLHVVRSLPSLCDFIRFSKHMRAILILSKSFVSLIVHFGSAAEAEVSNGGRGCSTVEVPLTSNMNFIHSFHQSSSVLFSPNLLL